MTRRACLPWLMAAALLACSAPPPPPRFAPGSLTVARFAPGAPDGLAVLDRQVNVEDGERDHPSDAYTVAIAEDERELRRLWGRYHLKSPRPTVDFRARLVVFFTENGFCNDGKLTSFALTSAGELIPEIQHGDMACLLSGGLRSSTVVSAASLPRRFFPAGTYVLRLQRQKPLAFVVRGADAPPLPLPSSPALTTAAPPARALPGEAHPRRARVVIGDVEMGGVWVRDDGVWIPMFSAERPARAMGLDDVTPDLVCDGERCAHPFVMIPCAEPECPASGDLLLIDRPLGAHGAWPTGEDAWNREIEAMERDPVLSPLFRPVHPRFPHPLPPPKEPRGWLSKPYTRISLEAAASAEEGRSLSTHAALLGGTVRLGARWAPYASHDTTWSGRIREAVLGDHWGVDLRLRALSELHAAGAPRQWFSAGLAIGADNALGDDNDESLVRIPSLIGLALPEIGFITSSGAPSSFYMSHALPLDVLLTRRVALEARPSFLLRFMPTHAAGPDVLLSFSLGLMLR